MRQPLVFQAAQQQLEQPQQPSAPPWSSHLLVPALWPPAWAALSPELPSSEALPPRFAAEQPSPLDVLLSHLREPWLQPLQPEASKRSLEPQAE